MLSRSASTTVRIDAFYDRTHLVENTLHTVGHSVLLGITLVVLVLLLSMGRPSVAALVALTVPFSLLFALILMYFTSIPIGLLSVGAIDFGIIVDGAIIRAVPFPEMTASLMLEKGEEIASPDPDAVGLRNGAPARAGRAALGNLPIDAGAGAARRRQGHRRR
jgi:multidrug efflux pump subunit AcrB